MQNLPKNKTEKQIIGQKGEDEAAKFLIRKGLIVIDRNYRKPWGELDIVARKGDQIYFVEVKTVTRCLPSEALVKDGDFYEPEDNIHPWKIKRLSRAIETYLLEKKIDDDIDWQVDSVAVYLNSRGEVLKIEHLEDIF